MKNRIIFIIALQNVIKMKEIMRRLFTIMKRTSFILFPSPEIGGLSVSAGF